MKAIDQFHSSFIGNAQALNVDAGGKYSPASFNRGAVPPNTVAGNVMKQNYAITISMLMLALILIGAQTHALFMSADSHGAAKAPALNASVVETLNFGDHHQRHDESPSPFDRDVPNIAIH
jgi:hypothetical protein